jgi:hypothetical protein
MQQQQQQQQQQQRHCTACPAGSQAAAAALPGHGLQDRLKLHDASSAADASAIPELVLQIIQMVLMSAWMLWLAWVKECHSSPAEGFDSCTCCLSSAATFIHER